METDLIGWQPHLESLRSFPLVAEAIGIVTPPRSMWDGQLRLQLKTGEKFWLWIEQPLMAELDPTYVQRLLQRVEQWPIGDPWVVLAPYVPAEVGAELIAKGVNYLDAVGNCYLRLDATHLIMVEGRRPPTRKAKDRPYGAPGYSVIFEVLAAPEAVGLPLRDLAARVGVAKSSVGDTLKRLEAEGFVGKSRSGRQLLDRPRLFERFMAGYLNELRPRLILGRFRPQFRDVAELQAQIEEYLRPLEHELPWAWGGGAAAYRMHHFYLGAETVLHIPARPPAFEQKLRLLPHPEGPLVLLRPAGPAAFQPPATEGAPPHCAHPILVYCELMGSVDPRAREAAGEVREKNLPWLS